MNNKVIHIGLLTIILCMISQYCAAKDTLVANIDEFNSAIKSVQSGDHIILKNGEWNNVTFNISGQGTKENPIYVKAETPGKVIITGDSNLTISGDYLIVKGLWFKDGFTTKKEVISFRKNSKEYATNSRVTECAVTNYNPDIKTNKYNYVSVWGKNNTIDHNYFIGKTNNGPVLVVWLKGENHIENNHKIEYNHFAGRPTLGTNGGETIRIGTSATSLSSSKTVVENNIFEKCNGEIEIISNKSCNNTFRNNLFLESQGTLTLRHGNGALVENNVFVGNNKSKTGGIRIINADHVVRNNMMIGLKGSGFRGPIVVMNGVPNSPANRYHQVKNVDIIHNTVIDCSPIQLSAGKDDERTLAPIHTTFANNIVFNSGSHAILEASDKLDGFTFKGNLIDTKSNFNEDGFTNTSIEWSLVNQSFLVPALRNGAKLKAFKITENDPIHDITGAKRAALVAGAYNLGNKVPPAALKLKAGPLSWKPIVTPLEKQTKVTTINVEPGQGTLNKAIKAASNGTILKLKSGSEYILDKGIKINHNITIMGDDPNQKPLIRVKDNLEKTPNYIFRIDSENVLKLSNLEITGKNTTPIKYVVASSKENQDVPFSVFIDNCYLHDFTNKKGGCIYKAYKGSVADTISITNSRIEDSFRGINLAAEKDDVGKYNAKVVILKNTVFNRIEQWALDYYQGGTNKTNTSGKLYVSNCVFSRVADTEKGKVLRTNGIIFVDIKDSVFEKSYTIKNPVNLSGIKNKITNSLVFNAGEVKTSNNAIAKNILYKNPKWEDYKNFIPSDKSPLINKESTSIGLTFKNKK